MEGFTFAGQMLWGLKIAVIGMLVVFTALVLVALSISIFRIDFKRNKKRAKQENKTENTIVAPVPVAEDTISPEIVAAISAAVAVVLNGSYRITKVHHHKTNSSAWKNQGIINIMDSHNIEVRRNR